MRYPIGQQDFNVLRSRDCVYVDKISFIEKLVNGGSQYYFLACPRRFGKSLFLSTLQYFFEGRRELFKGLYIDSTDPKDIQNRGQFLIKEPRRLENPLSHRIIGIL
ncbi:MAG: AAA family ATPase [Bacteroides sp.]|nr:AAA family ATPase [Bacteroides sp.]